MDPPPPHRGDRPPQRPPGHPARDARRHDRRLDPASLNYHHACLAGAGAGAGAGARARARAGDPPALLRHPGGRTDALCITSGLLLGIDRGADYQTTGIPLPSGSVLTLYTDGLVECPGTEPRRHHLRARRPPWSRRGREPGRPGRHAHPRRRTIRASSRRHRPARHPSAQRTVSRSRLSPAEMSRAGSLSGQFYRGLPMAPLTCSFSVAKHPWGTPGGRGPGMPLQEFGRLDGSPACRADGKAQGVGKRLRGCLTWQVSRASCGRSGRRPWPGLGSAGRCGPRTGS
ncbi:SpoIIE family protein phosphatase [Streptomyces sp. NRRL B-24720]|uniref:SpoIIE family protein phosphatase n=1 Tax=Streptomyces sp. NRRL B-24720 TaxID=1476876 RepID=UPI00099C0E52|nr:SpoIIE family protein phosphatase [Streptomyces sp. NRRL B-24720]